MVLSLSLSVSHFAIACVLSHIFDTGSPPSRPQDDNRFCKAVTYAIFISENHEKIITLLKDVQKGYNYKITTTKKRLNNRIVVVNDKNERTRELIVGLYIPYTNVNVSYKMVLDNWFLKFILKMVSNFC